MKILTRGIGCAALLLFPTSIVYAGHPAPGVQVTVNKGGTAVFRTVTDATGQFTTGDLEPGEYQIDVRGVKVVPPVRYFLVLSGARPLGQTLTNAGGDLAMQAQVRRLTSIRGQVSASRIIVLPGLNQPTNATSAGAATPASLNNVRPVAMTAAADQRPSAVGAGTQGRSPSTATTSNSATSVGRSAAAAAPSNTPRSAVAVASSSAHPTAASPTAPAASASTAATPVTGSKIIGGKRYIWVPSAPGSKLGHWVPETPQPAVSNATKPAGAAAPLSGQAGR
ncbi:MAG: carboxypeptidase regulatory-like domain-containing protein [Verrucomicrobiota bacterium]|nr:carboxypeptidase regulatory-like domain-containing protein [Verrucomicrobiota bacterium]